jgi:hypothetical protein
MVDKQTGMLLAYLISQGTKGGTETGQSLKDPDDEEIPVQLTLGSA